MIKKKHTQGLFLALLFLLQVPLVSAQQDSASTGERKLDVIHMKDGSMIKGKILQMEDDSVRMELQDGQVLELPRFELERIQMEVPRGPEEDPEDEETENRRPKGYQSHISTGLFLWNSILDLSIFNKPGWYSLHTYRFSPHFATGITLGFQLLDDVDQSPFFHCVGVVMTGDIIDGTPVTPLWDVQLGYKHHPISASTNPSGVFANLGLGCKFFIHEQQALSIQFGLQRNFLQNLEEPRGRGAAQWTHLNGHSIRISYHM